jgi:AcrR family transcriptional regulator
MTSPSARAADADDRQRQRRGDRRRQQILDAAVELFAANGSRGTGIAALAERVGMTAPGVLYYFGSKERLLLEVVAERDRLDIASMPSEIRLHDLRGLGRHNQDHETLTRLFAVLGAESFDRDSPLHEFFRSRNDLIRGAFRTLLASERDRGAVRSDVDLDQIAREMVAVVIGLEQQWLTDPDHFDYPAAVEAYFDRLVHDLAPSP